MRTHVGMYRIEDTLGRGGMGVVYRGVHERLNRPVAIKVLAPELTQQPEFKDRFFAEARTQARLQHPNIVAVYDLLEDGGEFFIVMEHVAGVPLDALLRETSGQGMEMTRACSLIAQVLTALDYAHSEAVIHRDVKPSNVLVTAGGRVKLMDFGIALLVGDKRLTASQASIGTPIYMSPEQILRPKQMDHRADIYSAAIMLHEMLAGEPPFDAETPYEINKLQIEAPPPDLCARRLDLPLPFAQSIQRALAKHPDDRFVSAGEFLRALESGAPAAFTSGAGSAAGFAGQLFIPTLVTPPPPAATSRGTGQGAVVSTAAAGTMSGGRLGVTPRVGRRGVWIAAAAALLAVSAVVAFVFSRLEPVAAPLAANAGAGVARAIAASPPAALERAAMAQAGGASSASAAPDRSAPRDAPATAAQGPSASTLAAVTAPETLGSSGRGRPAAEFANTAARRSAATSGAGGAAESGEIHRREVTRIREAVRSGIAKTEDEIAANDLAAARERVAGLLALAAKDQAELVDETVSLRLLEKKITSGIVAEKTAARQAEVDQAAWHRRLTEIQALIDKKSYPEAKQLAANLAADPATPPDVVAQARDLTTQADQALKSIFAKSKFGTTTNQIEKKPPR